MCNSAIFSQNFCAESHIFLTRPSKFRQTPIELLTSDSAQLIRYSNLKALERIRFDGLSEDGPSAKSELRYLYKQAHNRCLEYASAPKGWLVITGAVGLGKTHLAASIVNEAIALEIPAIYMPVPDFFAHLRGASNPYEDSGAADFFVQMREAKLLVLDD